MSEISIVIPVFNSEKTLGKCLNSLINQTFSDFEIICVDDGSTDNSYAILKEYADKDSRFCVIRQENQGQGVARNNGLELAKGKYISFTDPDDWCEPTMLEEARDCAEKYNVDAVRFFIKQWFESTGVLYPDNLNIRFKDRQIYSIEDVGNDAFYYSNSCNNKLFRMSFLKKNNIKFGTMRIAEDNVFCIKVLLLGKTLCLKRRLYNYRVRSGSTTFTVRHDPVREIAACKEVIDELGYSQKCVKEFCYYIKNRMFKLWDGHKILFFKIWLKNRKNFPKYARHLVYKEAFKRIRNLLFSCQKKNQVGVKVKYLQILGCKIVINEKI